MFFFQRLAFFNLLFTDNDGLLTLPDMKKMMELFTSLRSEEMRCRCKFITSLLLLPAPVFTLLFFSHKFPSFFSCVFRV